VHRHLVGAVFSTSADIDLTRFHARFLSATKTIVVT
jgi:hypothetical protein